MRYRRKALQIGEREHGWPIDHAVDQERVARRIDLGDAAVMPLEVQIGRRDDAHQILMRRPGRRGSSDEALKFFGARPLPVRARRLAADFGRIGRW